MYFSVCIRYMYSELRDYPFHFHLLLSIQIISYFEFSLDCFLSAGGVAYAS